MLMKLLLSGLFVMAIVSEPALGMEMIESQKDTVACSTFGGVRRFDHAMNESQLQTLGCFKVRDGVEAITIPPTKFGDQYMRVRVKTKTEVVDFWVRRSNVRVINY